MTLVLCAASKYGKYKSHVSSSASVSNKLRCGVRRFPLCLSRTVTSLSTGCAPSWEIQEKSVPTTHRGRGEEGELSHNASVRFGNSGRMEWAAISRPLVYRYHPARPISLSLKRKFFPYIDLTRATIPNIIGEAHVCNGPLRDAWSNFRNADGNMMLHHVMKGLIA